MYTNNEMFGDLVHDVGLVGQIIGTAGVKLRNFFIRKAQGPRVVAPDPELLRTRQLQSAKIELRLLGRQHKYDEILAIATSTESDETARWAVMEIVEGDLEEVECIQFLAAVANSFSKAAVPATVVLLNKGEMELALSIFLERLANGELARLVQSGRAKLLSVLDLLGALDTIQETDHSSEHFDQLFQSLAENPARQVEALLEILGDPKPNGPRGLFAENSVTQTVKLKAISLLQYFSVDDKDRALSFAAKDVDDVIAHLAVMNLLHLWQSQNLNGMVPNGLEPFPLLNTNLLIQLCQISAAFHWHDSVAAEAILQKHLDLVDQLSAATLAENQHGQHSQYNQQERLDSSNHANQSIQVVINRLQKQVDGAEKEIKRITENRINMLQPLINRITQSLGIPNASLSTCDDPAISAAYGVGSGSIQLNRRILLDDKPLSEDLMSTLLHEIGHMEQDVLVIRMIADDLGLKFGQHADLLYPLYERYASGIGYAPESMFLLAVLRLRGDRPLSAPQRQRAMRLHQAAYQTNIGHEHFKLVKNRYNRLSDSYDELDDGKHDSQLLACLSNTRTIAGWFSRGSVPAILLYEMENCKQDLSRIFESLSKGPQPKDIVSWAQKSYHSKHKELIEPIVLRLRTLLMQVLQEECQRLDKEMSELRRAGYHESEAYTISDRVEVIVKSLRRNW